MNDNAHNDRLKKAASIIRRLEERLHPLEEAARVRSEPIAVIGVGCRFPGGADSPEALWRLLDEGRDAVSSLDRRWATLAAHPGDLAPRWAGLLEDPIDQFDAAFFGISPREASALDPQQRLLLEVAWEGLERAGIAPRSLAGSRTGVFLGAITSEYLEVVKREPRELRDAYTSTGNLLSVAAGRVSYTLGLEGPCLTVDTACSSSLVAIHLACQSLRAGESELALAGGVNLLLSVDSMIDIARLQALAPDGRAKTFDAAANGFVRGEGCGLVVLKRLSDALRSGDEIWGLIRGSAMNQDGGSTGLTAPNVLAQESLLRDALRDARVEPSAVGYIEAHGTGTPLGDPIEVEALRSVLGARRADGSTCWLGALKTNMGHLEAAAGIAGFIKALLVLRHGRIPKNLHFRTLNPRLRLEDTALRVASEPIAWPRSSTPRIAGVSGFGLSGTNAHVVLEEAPLPAPAADGGKAAAQPRSAELLLLSAKTSQALDAQAARLAEHLRVHRELALLDVAGSLATTRSALEHRIAIVATPGEPALTLLQAVAAGETPAGTTRARALGKLPKVVFVFPGHGSQWLGMGRQLLAEEPVFRSAIEACDYAIRAEAGWSLLDELLADEARSQLHRTEIVQPALFAMAVALAALWRSYGVEPDALVGHSMGEIAAAHVAGALSLEDAVAVVCRRSHTLREIFGRGEMALVELPLREAEAALAGYEDKLSVAVNNSPRSTVIAGEPAAMASVLGALEQRGVFCRRVKVDYASHSPQVDALRDRIIEALAGISARELTIPMRSTVSCASLRGRELDARYWADNLRQPVRFHEAVQALVQDGHGVFIELSPHPLLLPAIDEIRRAAKRDGIALGSLRRSLPEREALLESLGALWALGRPANPQRWFPDARRVALPVYPWQRERYWIDASVDAAAVPRSHRGGHPLLGHGLRISIDESQVWETTLDLDRLPWLRDHRVRDALLFPAAAYLEMILASAAERFGLTPYRIRDAVFAEALVLGEAQVSIQLVITPEGRDRLQFQIASKTAGADAFQQHVRGTLAPAAERAPSGVNLAEVAARLALQSIERMYSVLRELGLQHGPAFQSVVELWRGPNEALGRLQLPAAAAGPGEYRVHPSLLDGCLQIMAHVFDDDDGATWVPIGVESLQLFAAPAEVLFCHARRNPNAERSADFALLDGSGAVIAEVRGLTLKRIAGDADTSSDGILDSVFELSAQPPARIAAGRFLLLGRGGGLGDALAQALRAQGHQVALVEDAVHSDLRATLLTLFDGAAPQHVVCLASLDAPETLDADGLEQTLRCGSDVALRAVQALVTAAYRDAPRLWLVTRGAQAAISGEPVSPLQATMLGFRRAIAAEHAELRCTAIDLDLARPAGEVAALLAELLADDFEEEIALRGSERRTGRLLARANPSARKTPLELRADATYLITGGLGGLGLQLASWLAEHGAGQLVLVGRSGAASPAQSAAVAELTARGVRVLVAQADVSDRVAVAKLLEDVAASGLPLRGVFHVAAVLDDGIALKQTPERLRTVMRPKALGALHLHELTRELPLDYFVMYASAAGLLGSPAQSNYAAANTFLDALAQHRRTIGLPALSVDWGAFAQVGIVAEQAGGDSRLASRGILSMTPEQGHSVLERLLDGERAQVGVVPLDVRQWIEVLPTAASSARLSALLAARAALPAGDSELLQQLAAAGEPEREAMLRERLCDLASRVLRIPRDKFDDEAPLTSLGMDSLMSLELRNRIEATLGLVVPATLLWTYPNIVTLSSHLVAELRRVSGLRGVARTGTSTTSVLRTQREHASDAIAIVGMGCRFPGGANDPEAYWQLLASGRDAIEALDARWALAGVQHPEHAPRWAGLLDTQLDQFDATFFGISPREAHALDPQQRLLLEVAWEALEHACIVPRSLVGSRTGVFIGAITADYAQLLERLPPEQHDMYGATGNMISLLAGRVSYTFGLQGPSLMVDTACSSSLVAVHLACRSLFDGESDLALAGGVNVILSAASMAAAARLQALAPDGRCKVFDAAANGFVRGEGAGLVVLKRLRDAERDGDRIWAVIRGSAVNQDGRSTGLTAPNVLAQQALLTEAYAQAGISPAAVGYIEAHGTGTSLGDPIEIEALRAVLSEPRLDGSRCLLGAVKTNLGHLEGAAGIAGLMKAVLALEHEQIPPNLNFRTLNPRIRLDDSPLALALERTDWPRGEQPRVAGVSSFGMSGTNAHIVLEEAPRRPERAAALARPAELFVLSGKTAAALDAQAAALAAHLQQHPDQALADVASTLAIHRSALDHRLAIVASSAATLREKLEHVASGQLPAGAARNTASARGKLAFMFTGQGAQAPGMGRELHATWPAFREVFDRTLELFDAELTRPLREVMWAEPGSAEAALLDQTQYTQPALFAFEYALCALWRSWGIEPELLVGHSIGEIVAACVAGVFSLEDAVQLVSARARLMQALPAGGAMVSISASEAAVRAELSTYAQTVSIAAINAPDRVVISGAAADVTELAQRFAARNVYTRALRVSHAFHSPSMDAMLAAFERIASALDYREPQLPLASNVSGELASSELSTPAYWVRQVRDAVRFSDAVRALAAAGVGTFLELGPRAMLTGVLPSCLPAGDALGVSSVRNTADENTSVLSALGALFCAGRAPQWSQVFPTGSARVQLPTYRWQGERYWIDAPPQAEASRSTGRWLLSGTGIPLPGERAHHLVRVSTALQSYLADHVVYDRNVVAGAFHVSVILAVAAEHWPEQAVTIQQLEFVSPLVLEPGVSCDLLVALERSSDHPGFDVEVSSRQAADGAWSVHVRCQIGPDDAAFEPSMPLEEALAETPRAVDVTALFDGFAERHIQLGPKWRCMTEAQAGDGIALVTLRASNDSLAPLHPVLLDNCFAALAAAFGARDGDEAMLPFALERLRWLRPARGRVRCCATASSSEGAVTTADFTLWDETDSVVAELSGFSVRSAPQEALFQALHRTRSSALHRLAWQPATLAAGPLPEGPWLVVSDATSPLGAALASQLACEAVTPQQLAAAVPARAQVVCVFEARPGEDAAARAARVSIDGLTIVQAIRGRAARTVWLTSGAVAVDAESVDPGLAAIWGLGRTLLQERPELGCKLVDVSGSDAQEILRELAIADDERQVAWRDGQRHVLRLVAAPASDARVDLSTLGLRDRTLLITGGLGALGLSVARWFARNTTDAHLLLTGRRGASTPGVDEALEEMRAAGAHVHVAAVDISDRTQVEALLASIPSQRPLAGIVHAAGVLDDGLLDSQDAARFARVLAPKVAGAFHLHELTASTELEFFVSFSSLAGSLGSAGQAAYAAANSFLDALALQRRAQGLVGQSLAWGPWSQIGMAARLHELEQARLSERGLTPLSPDEALELFARALARPEPHLVLARIDSAALERATSRSQRFGASSEGRAPLRPRAAWAQQLAELAPAARIAELRSQVQSEVARVLAMDTVSAVPLDRPFLELGLDSVMAVELRDSLGRRLGMSLPATLAFDHPTVEALASWLLARALPDATGAQRPRSTRRALADEPIAIVGMACRFPGANDPQSLWHLLDSGSDAITQVPRERWDADALYDPDPDAAGKLMTREGGFLSGVDQFDPEFFGISPREAASIDPQQRLLLEVSWEALEHAGIAPERLMGSDSAVFVGQMYQEYAGLAGGLEALDGHLGTGSSSSVTSGRISYVLGLKGPSMTVDTACSSSLVTLHLACQALRRGECSLALSGGVTLMLTPGVFVEFARLRGMAADGRCKSFSAAADGVAWSEGCAMLVLKRRSDAERDGDRILALVRGSAVNQDGRSAGLTAPNGPSQEDVIRRALEQARVTPAQVSYVECHGTGTPLGDPIEAQALGAVMSAGRSLDRPVVIGSVKSNFGHTQAAAGAAGVMKVVMALQHERIPKSLHFDAPSPHIPWAELPLSVATESQAWSRNGAPRIAGVSSFGLSGTNAHVVLEEPPPRKRIERTARAPASRSELFLISARSAEALNQQAARLSEHLERHPEFELADVAYSLATTRSALSHRLAITARTRDGLREALHAAASGETPALAARGIATGEGKLAFVFTGQGAQLPGMGREAYAAWPAFREAFDRCAALYDRFQVDGPSLTSVMWGADTERLDQTQYTQPALFALEYALVAQWKAFGVEPSFVIGHSVGELVAACVAGVFSLEDALRLVIARAQLMQALPSGGAMLSIAAPLAEVASAIAAHAANVSIAAVNGPEQIVISGEREAVSSIAGSFAARGVRTRSLQVSHAFHSPAMDAMLADFRHVAETVTYRAPALAIASNLSGELATDTIATADYWVRHVREAVRFAEGIGALAAAGARTFVEVGPRPALLGAVAACIPELEPVLIASLRSGSDEGDCLLSAAGSCWTRGVSLEASRLFAADARRVELPTYAWQRTRHWHSGRPRNVPRAGQDSGHPLLGARVPAAFGGVVFESTLMLETHPWLRDHCVSGLTLLPGAALAELVHAAAVQAAPELQQVCGLVFREPLLLPETGGQRIQVVLDEGTSESRGVAIYSQPADSAADASWTLHATAKLRAEGEAHTAVDLSGIRARCVEEIDVPALHERLAEAGLAYGPAFRGLRALACSNGEALAELSLPLGVAAESYALHPALLDAALQAVAAATVSVGGDALWLPFELGSYTVYSPGLEPAFASVRSHGSGEGTSADIRLLSAEGDLIAQVTELRVKRADVAALARSVDAASDDVYRLEWRPAALAATQPSAAEATGTWIVVANPGSVAGERLALQLAAASTTPYELAQVLERSHDPIAGVVCLWEAEAGRELSDSVQARAIAALAVVHALRGRTLPLCWVTRGAIALGLEERVELSCAPLWGLGRTLRQERPELTVKLVDIGQQPGAHDDLLRELRAHDGEDELIWRDGKRYAARMMRCPPCTGSAVLPLPASSTVLVSGGLGGLGLAVARWLAGQGVAHLVLLGRRGRQTPGLDDALRELQATGVRVTVAAVDVSNRGALAALLDSLPAELPLRGVVHAAGVLDDGMLDEQDAERFARVLAPKVAGALHLHELTAGRELSFFTLFSSLAGVLGSAGQGSYAAANSFLDALAVDRRAQGLPAQSLAWGAWADAGMASRLADAQQARLARRGFRSLRSEEGLALLARALERPEATLGLTRLDLRALAQSLGTSVPPIWRGLVKPRPKRSNAAAGAWAQRLARLPVAKRLAEARAAVQSEVARALALSSASVPLDRAFSELGLDSLTSVELANALGERVGARLPSTVAYDYPNVEALSRHLLETALASQEASEPIAPGARAARADEPIAILGIGCRFPAGISDPASFWRLLDAGRDAITEVPSSRWNADALFDADPDARGKTQTRSGGFVSDIDQFDPAFFGISPREAAAMDPQQRLLLETSWEALEHAGIPPERLMGTDTAVFVGHMYQEYANLAGSLDALDAYTATGNAAAIASGRISYVLGLKGPSLTVDTACSSSLVTMHLGCQSLQRGECSVALVGGVALMVTPAPFVELGQLGVVAPDGRCKTFSASADGVGWGEGCAMLVLKRLSDAERDGDRILAVVRGSAVNQDGRSNGLTAPNGPSQEEVIRRALASGGIAPSQVSYVECHGTGTTLGDPIEVRALGAVLAPGRAPDRPVLIGSVKSNVGHTQSAAGAAGLIKVVLSLLHERIPATLNFDAPSPHIPWSELPVRVASEPMAWPRNGVRRIAGVSSFGLSGTNAHIVLEEAPLPKPAATRAEVRGAQLCVLSAKSARALATQAERLSVHLSQHPELALHDVAFSLATARSAMDQRAAIVASTREELLQSLSGLAQGRDALRTVRGLAAVGGAAKLVFVYPGQGSQWLGMGRSLLEQEPVFREAIAACDRAIQAEAGWSLIAELQASETESRLSDPDVIQPALFSMSVALTALWQSWGVTPDVVVGHSMGEIAAAYTAGALSLRDAVAVACRRSRELLRIRGQGEMALVELPMADVAEALRGYEDRLSVAVNNSAHSTVISGEPQALAEVLDTLSRRDVFCRRVKVEVAGHSPQMDPLLDDVAAALHDITPQACTVPMRSTLQGKMLEGPELVARYWADSLRQPVLFADAVQALIDDGYALFLELTPHPVLSLSIEESIKANRVEGAAVGSLQRHRPDRDALLESLGVLWTHGYEPDWRRVSHSAARRVDLPTYAFQRERHWFSTPRRAQAVRPKHGHPLLGEALELAMFPGARCWSSSVSCQELPWLADHRVYDTVVFPGAGHVELALAAGATAFEAAPFEVRNIEFEQLLVVPAEDERPLQVGVRASQAGHEIEVSGRQGQAWTRYARAELHAAAGARELSAESPDAIRARCATELSGEAWYAELAARGISYGPCFQGVERIWLGDDEALGRVHLPQGLEGDRYQLHPALLDASFQVTGSLFAKGTEADGGGAGVPVSIERVYAPRRPGSEVWVHARSRRSQPDARAIDLTLLDDDANVLAEIEGLCVQRIAPSAVPGWDPAAGLLFELAWQRLEALPPRVLPQRGAWLVLADRKGVGAALCASMEAAGNRCVLVEHGPSFARVATDRFRAPGDSESMRMVLRSAFADDAPCSGVLHLWSLDAGAPDSVTPANLSDDLELTALSAMHLAQALLHHDWRVVPRLWLVTNGAEAVGGEPRIAFNQACLSGFARALRLEHPELAVARVDLPLEPCGEDAARLLDELLANAAEDQVALRADGRYGARLTRSPAPKQLLPVALRADATYLITGGLSGLGLSVAEWMVEHGARQLVLVGRSGASEVAQVTVDRLVERGARVEVIRADVSRFDEVAQLFARLSRELPPLRGVVHSAAVLADATLLKLDAERVRAVMGAKVHGALHLHLLTRELPLDFFVMYASAAGLLGSAGQSNYAAANTFLDALAHHRRRSGLPALSIDWGMFSDIGRAAQRVAEGERLAFDAELGMSAEQGLVVLERLLSDAPAQVGAFKFDVRGWVESNPGIAASPFWSILQQESARAASEEVSAPGQLRAELLQLDAPDRAGHLMRYLAGLVGRALGLDPSRIELRASFVHLGMDSLMGLRVRNRIEADLEQRFSAALLLSYPTLEGLTAHVLEKLGLEAEATPSLEQRASADDALAIEDEVAAMSESELLQIISSKYAEASGESHE